MGAFIAKQPNGLLCRFSSVVDCVTHYNMTEDDYVEMCAERARKEARFNLEKDKHFLRPFSMVKESFLPNNMTEEEFEDICLEMETEVNTDTTMKTP